MSKEKKIICLDFCGVVYEQRVTDEKMFLVGGGGLVSGIDEFIKRRIKDYTIIISTDESPALVASWLEERIPRIRFFGVNPVPPPISLLTEVASDEVASLSDDYNYEALVTDKKVSCDIYVSVDAIPFISTEYLDESINYLDEAIQ